MKAQKALKQRSYQREKSEANQCLNGLIIIRRDRQSAHRRHSITSSRRQQSRRQRFSRDGGGGARRAEPAIRRRTLAATAGRNRAATTAVGVPHNPEEEPEPQGEVINQIAAVLTEEEAAPGPINPKDAPILGDQLLTLDKEESSHNASRRALCRICNARSSG